MFTKLPQKAEGGGVQGLRRLSTKSRFIYALAKVYEGFVICSGREYRRKGLASRLMAQCETMARSLGTKQSRRKYGLEPALRNTFHVLDYN